MISIGGFEGLRRPGVPRTKFQSSEGTPAGKAPAMTTRFGLGPFCTLVLTGCASATALRVDRSDVIGPCQTAVPDRDVLFGVALSAARKAEATPLASPEEVKERIAEIPTRLVLGSECDR